MSADNSVNIVSDGISTVKEDLERSREIRRMLSRPQPRFLAFGHRSSVNGRVTPPSEHSIEGLLLCVRYGSVIAFFAIFVWDILRQHILQEAPNVLLDNQGVAVAASVISLLVLALLVLELATYRPRIHVAVDEPSQKIVLNRIGVGEPPESGNSQNGLLERLGRYNPNIILALSEIRDTPASKWSEVVSHEQRLLHAAKEFLILERLKAEIAARVLGRVILLIFVYALVGQFLDVASGYAMISNIGTNPGQPQYFSVGASLFFTETSIGTLTPTVWGDGYLLLGGLLILTVGYFVVNSINGANQGLHSMLEREICQKVLGASSL